MWFSVVSTLIYNDMHHHSGQNVVDSLALVVCRVQRGKMFFSFF